MITQAIAGQEYLAHLLQHASQLQAKQANAIQSQLATLAEEAAGTRHSIAEIKQQVSCHATETPDPAGEPQSTD